MTYCEWGAWVFTEFCGDGDPYKLECFSQKGLRLTIVSLEVKEAQQHDH